VIISSHEAYHNNTLGGVQHMYDRAAPLRGNLHCCVSPEVHKKTDHLDVQHTGATSYGGVILLTFCLKYF